MKNIVIFSGLLSIASFNYACSSKFFEPCENTYQFECKKRLMLFAYSRVNISNIESSAIDNAALIVDVETIVNQFQRLNPGLICDREKEEYINWLCNIIRQRNSIPSRLT